MAAPDADSVKKQRLLFKKFNRFMLGMWRMGLGGWVNAWPAVGGRIMIIEHIGRRTGLPRQTPVNYAEVDGEIYCTAGFGGDSDWYRNCLAHPQVNLQLPNGRWAAEAEDASDCEQRTALLRQVLIASGVVAPLMGLHPRSMPDADLAAATPEYRLVRFHRLAALQPEGNSDRS